MMQYRILTLLLSVSMILTACGKKGEKAHEAPKGPVIKVTVAKVEKGEIPIYVESVGTVKAVRESVVESKVMGSLTRINFREGDRVKKGTLLLEIDARDINAQVEQAQAAVSEAAASFRNAEVNLRRMQTLLEDKSVTRQQYDAAVMQHDMAKARTQQAHANVQALKVMLDYTRIEAPFSGVVTAKMAEVGEMASPGRPLFKIIDDSVLLLETDMKESEITGVKAAKEIDVRIDAIDKTLKGKVSKVIPSGDPATHSFLVKIELPSGGILPGMFGRALTVKGKSSALLVPEGAITVRGGLPGVYVVSEGSARFRMIRKGLSTDGRAEVLSGLSEGETVAVTSVDMLMDGSPVEVIK